MSELGILFLVLAVQITLPLAGGLLLSLRREPSAATIPLAIAAIVVLLLTPIAFIPKPDWHTAARPTPVVNESPSVDVSPAGSITPSGGIDLLHLFRLPKPLPVVEKPAEFDPYRIVALAVIGLAAFGFIRFASAFVATLNAVRSSRRVDDPGLQATVREVTASLGCRRIIDLRESPRVGSAATAGWFRPVVLLSPAWRSWSVEERRAVVAHEIAHVSRGDFTTRLLTRLSVALHGYHPLLRWLAARLELQQEMAADALAARCCGGRPAYLKSLAALALKADGRPLGFVPTFFSRPRTLLRRVAMLRVKEDTTRRPRYWLTVAMVGLLATVGLGLRGTTPSSLAGPIVPAKFAVEDRVPLDAQYIVPSKNENEVGVFAVRVGELSRMPDLKNVADMCSSVLASAFGEGKKTNFTLADIDQIAGRVSLAHNPDLPKNNRSLSMSLTSVRMAKDFDWPKQIQEWGSEWKEHTHSGTKYFSAKMTVPALGFKDQTVWFYLPDSRTVVLESEANIKHLVDAKKKPQVKPWAEDWKAVERGTFAMVLPDVKGTIVKKLPGDEIEGESKAAVFKAIRGLCTKTSRAAIGVDLGESCSVKVRFACANAADADDVREGCESLVKMAKVLLEESNDESEKANQAAYSQFIQGVRFDKKAGHVVEVRLNAKSGVSEMLKSFGASAEK